MTDLDQKALDAAAIALSGAPFATKNSLARATRTIAAYLAALPPSPAVVQSGWKLVPVEADEAMIGAGVNEAHRQGGSYAASAIYRAMLAAAPPSPPDLDGAGRDGITDEMVRAGAFAAWASTTPFAGLTEAAFRAKSDEHVQIADLGQGTTLEQDMLLDWELNADTFCILARATLKAAIRSLKETP